MPNDFTPRMLRAFRLQSTTTRRPCAAGELSALDQTLSSRTLA
jgi:hypothetical protein